MQEKPIFSNPEQDSGKDTGRTHGSGNKKNRQRLSEAEFGFFLWGMIDPRRPGILFLGTPDFAAASLKKLLDMNARVLAVVTAPDKPAGRGLQLRESPVKIVAQEAGLPVFQPEKLRDPDFLEAIRRLEPDLGIVVAFRMLPEAVWNMPRLGTFNLHASLLPAYRGAAPIHHALMNGETETGLSTFFLQHAIDTGDLLMQKRIPVFPDDNLGSLSTRMQEEGAELVCQTLKGIGENRFSPVPQDESRVSYAPKITPETCRIDPSCPAEKIHNQIRGLSPFPGAFLETPAGKIKITASTLLPLACNGTPPGTFRRQEPYDLQLATGDYWLSVNEIQPEGRKRMSARDFLIGNKAEILNQKT